MSLGQNNGLQEQSSCSWSEDEISQKVERFRKRERRINFGWLGKKTRQ